MQKILPIILAILGWFAIIAQLVLFIENRTTPLAETIVRFFSYFTILTNILVATYFTAKSLNAGFTKGKSLFSAITVYILIVGIVYQVALRQVWDPQGLQKVVDELLHSVIPAGTFFFWMAFDRNKLSYSALLSWSIYPLVYLALILMRGYFTAYYPYPFLDVEKLGYPAVFLHSFFILITFIVIAGGMILANNKFKNSFTPSRSEE